MQATAEATRPLLRPQQVEELTKDVQAAEAKLSSPHIEDKGEVRRQLLRLRKSLDEQRPREPASADEEGKLVARSRQLLEEILADGMCSQAEMRGAPPGAVDKHIRWERRNKAKILEWKNLQLRLQPGEREAANLERFRPTASSLGLDNSVVDRKLIFNVEQVTGPTVTFNDQEMTALQALAPEIAETVATLSNDERGVIKRMIAGLVSEAAAPTKGGSKK